MTGRAIDSHAAELPPHTTLFPIRVSDEMVPELVGKTIYCAWFRVESCGDGTYDMTVSQDRDDSALQRLDDGTLWENPA